MSSRSRSIAASAALHALLLAAAWSAGVSPLPPGGRDDSDGFLAVGIVTAAPPALADPPPEPEPDRGDPESLDRRIAGTALGRLDEALECDLTLPDPPELGALPGGAVATEESADGSQDPPPSIAVLDPVFGRAARATLGRGRLGLPGRAGARATGSGGGCGDGPGNTGDPPAPVEVATAPLPDPPRAAHAVHAPPPSYPESARRDGREGLVLLEVDVLADGSVAAVRVLRSSGWADLDDSAVAAVRRWTFEPRVVGGRAVASTLRVRPIRFRLVE